MTKTYHIITFGCQMQKNDSERIASLFNSLGLKSEKDIEKADILVVNMCSVRQSAVDRIYGFKPKITSLKKRHSQLKTILTGCILEKDKQNFKTYFDYVLNIRTLPEWPYIIGLRSKSWKIPVSDYLKIKPAFSSFPVAYVPISTGCNNFCAYCVVPFTRGQERYRPVKDILYEVKKAVKEGFKEIWLLGENVNSYWYKTKSGQIIDFPKLLKRVNDIKGNFWLRFTSPHPKNFSPALIEILPKCDKFQPYLNIPLQSGSNNILKRMRRGYTQERYLEIISSIRKRLPDISISTDIIVGFPGETRKDFNETIKVFKKANFDMAYIAQYSPRPGTEAALTMKDNVSPKEKMRREKKLTQLLKTQAIKFNKKFVGETTPVLVMKQEKNILIGKSPHNKTVKIKPAPQELKDSQKLIGQFIETKITKAMDFGLEGEIAKPKLIAIVGPTASGKSALGVELAKKFKGEIVSADSRQVFKGMDIGTGKITKKEMQGIPHYLLDVVSPKTDFSVARYQEKAFKAIDKIIEKGKIPFLVGGSPFYVYSVIEGWVFPKMKKDVKLRRSLEKKSAQELFELLKKLAPERAETIEKQNKRRLIRAIEIAKTLGYVPSLQKHPRYECLIIGIKKEKAELKKLISKRLIKRIRQGMIAEVKKLHQQGVSWSRLENFGLEYRWVARYLQNKIAKEEMIEKLQKDIEKFARRQMTWFKKDIRINWIKNKTQAEKLVRKFIKNS